MSTTTTTSPLSTVTQLTDSLPNNGFIKNGIHKDVDRLKKSDTATSLNTIDITTSMGGKQTLKVPKQAPQQPIDDNDEFIDPACDPRHPQDVHFSDISSAAFNIRDGIIRSPCTVSPDDP